MANVNVITTQTGKGCGSVVINGTGCSAGAQYAVMIGTDAMAQSYGIAIGCGASAGNNTFGGVAIGAGTVAAGRSVAIGSGCGIIGGDFNGVNAPTHVFIGSACYNGSSSDGDMIVIGNECVGRTGQVLIGFNMDHQNEANMDVPGIVRIKSTGLDIQFRPASSTSRGGKVVFYAPTNAYASSMSAECSLANFFAFINSLGN